MKTTARPLAFGEVLTILRNRQGLSPAELADLVDWPLPQIQAIEAMRCEDQITEAEAIELAKALDIDPRLLTVAVPK